MAHTYRKRHHPPGTRPGTLTAHAERKVENVEITVVDYTKAKAEEHHFSKIEEAFPFIDKKSVTWIDIVGLHDVSVLEKLGERCHLHPLALEDVLNTGQRPKLEDYEDYHFIVLKLVHLERDVDSEQISFFLSKNFVITLREERSDIFKPVQERIAQDKGRIRDLGTDYLAYALLDTLIDHFFPILEEYGERLDDLEDQVVENADRETLGRIHAAKRELLQLRRSAWPQREVINGLERIESDLISKETRFFLRDCYDHTIQIMDVIETYRDIAGGLLDVYLSSLSNKMNEVMKFLTITATIFIPLTFIAGVYGMNFNPQASPWNMPELSWKWGYPGALGLMAVVAIAMYFFFRHKGWLGK